MTISLMQDAANALKKAAGIIAYHADRKRVTHTRKNAKSAARHLANLFLNLETDDSFKKQFEAALYQAQVGPTEIRFSRSAGNFQEIFIQGNFSIAQLREYFVLSEPKDTITLDVAGPVT